MYPKYLYHVTDSNRVDKIQSSGLIACVGDNMSMVRDTTGPAVYLCKQEDIAYWKILLGKDAVVRVDTASLEKIHDVNYVAYSLYGEFIVNGNIEPEYISRLDRDVDTAEEMYELCVECMLNISDMIVFMTRVGTHPELYNNSAMVVRMINHDVNSVCAVSRERLDYSTIDTKRLSSKLVEYGEDGDYTMCDMYCVNERFGKLRLYEQLIKFDFSNTLLSRVKDSYVTMNKLVSDLFPWAVTIQTGGYTG